jgi:hypothetical protein
MNDCKFFGKVVSRKITEENNTSKIELNVSVQKQRKSKHGVPVSETVTLQFEAWDSAAATIEHNSTVGDYLIINSTAKTHGDRVYFRINEFRIVRSGNLIDS